MKVNHDKSETGKRKHHGAVDEARNAQAFYIKHESIEGWLNYHEGAKKHGKQKAHIRCHQWGLLPPELDSCSQSR